MNNKGMTLIEIVVVLAILSVLAATLIPSAGTQIKRAKIEATRVEMLRIKDALLAFYDDVQQATGPNAGRFRFPVNLTQLETDPGVNFTGWRGPYIISGFDVQDYTQDEWRRNYNYLDTQVYNDNICVLRSAGSDLVFMNANDIVLTIDATMIINEKIARTREELEVIKEQAQRYFENIGTYPANIAALSASYIASEYQTDEWGVNYDMQGPVGNQNRRYFYSWGPNRANNSNNRDFSSGPAGDDIFPY